MRLPGRILIMFFTFEIRYDGKTNHAVGNLFGGTRHRGHAITSTRRFSKSQKFPIVKSCNQTLRRATDEPEDSPAVARPSIESSL